MIRSTGAARQHSLLLLIAGLAFVAWLAPITPAAVAQDPAPADPAAHAAAVAEAKRIASLVWSAEWGRDDLEAHAKNLTAALVADPDGPLAMTIFNALEHTSGDLLDPEGAFDPVDAIDLDTLTNAWNARSIRLRRINRLQLQGRRDEAIAQYRKLPLVREAAVLGPLEIPGRAALSLPLQPDSLRDPLAASGFHSAVTDSTVEWRREKLDERRFDRFFGGRGDWRAQRRGAGYYLATQLVVSGMLPRRVNLRIYGSMAFRVSINGDLIGTFDQRRELLPANLMMPVDLSPGRHVLVVKYLGAEQQSIEVTDDNGNWPAHVAVNMDAKTPLGTAVPVSDNSISWGWQGECLRLGKVAPDCAEALLLASMAQMGRGLIDAAWTLAKQAHACSETPLTCWSLAQVQEAHRELPAAIRTREAVALYQKAIELDPQFAPAIYELANDELENDRPDAARKLYDGIATFAPQSLHAQLARRSIFRAKRLEHLDHKLMSGLRDRAPKNPAVRSYFANWYDSLPDPRAARELAATELADNPGDDSAAVRVLTLTERIGDRDSELPTLWERALTDFYESDSVLRAAAEFFHRQRQYARQIALLEQLLGRNPAEAASIHEQIGMAAFANGDNARGTAEFEAVLQQDSDRHDLRRFLAQRSGVDLYAFADNYRPDVDKLIADAPTAAQWPRSPAIQLHSSTVLKVYDDNSYIGVVTLVRKVLTRQGVDMFGTIQAGGELIEARVIQPDGSSFEPTVSGWSMQMPQLEPGSVQVMRYRVQESAPGDGRLRLPRFWFGDPQRQEPILLTRLVILMPLTCTDEPIGYNFPEAAEGFEGLDRTLTFEATNVKADDLHEAHEPSDTELIPWVEFRPLRDWTEVWAQILNSGTPWRRVTSTIREKAEEIRAGVTIADDATDKVTPVVRAVYEAVNDIVKEDGWGESPTATLMTARGDRESLFLSLLAALDIEAATVHVSLPALSRLWDKVDFGEPQMDQFRAELIRIPRPGMSDLYLSLGSRLLPFGRLPAGVNGGTALICDEKGCRFGIVEGPSLLADARRTSLDIHVNIDGSADVKGEFVSDGVDGANLNDRFRRVPDFQKRQQATGLAASLVGAIDLSQYKFTNPDEPDTPGTPFRATFAGRVASFAQVSGNEVSFRGGPRPLDLASGLAPTATRGHDVYLRVGPIALVDRTVYRVGEGLSVISLPSPVALHNESVTYSRSVHHTRDEDTGEHVIEIERTVMIQPARLPQSAWARWLRFCQDIDQAELESIRLSK